MHTVAPTLDPRDFVVAPPVAALDEFTMRADDGSFVAQINESFIDRFVARMNEREHTTGDLAPLVIGHTSDPEDGFVPETAQPPVVGYARGWFKDELGTTGRKAAFFTPWIMKAEAERVKRYPRRSCEVWVSRYEADPISLLGASTPARDLGLMKLARNGSMSYCSPGDAITMPDLPKPDPKESGAAKSEDGKMDQLLSMMTQLLEAVKPAAVPEPENGKEDEDELSDEEIEKMLQDADRHGEEPVKESAYGVPGGTNTHVNLSRLEDENRDLRIRLSRMETRKALEDLGSPEADPKDEAFISDLIAMPPDVRQRTLDRLKKLGRREAPRSSGLSEAVNQSAGTVEGKRLGLLPADQARAEKERITKLARTKGQSFEEVARAEGYTL